MRTVSFVVLAMLSLAGCAASTAPYALPGPATSYPSAPPPGPNIYTTAPHASLHSELFACRNRGSNLGEIGMRGESVLYTPYIDTPAGPLLRQPVETACLSSGYGWRGTASGGGRQHNGVDLANPDGGWIFAAGEGRVRAADYSNGYGNVVVIDHGRGVQTTYAHLAEINPAVRPGAHVDAGVAIGRMGMTGNATGVHLHYEVLVDGLLVDPLNYGRPPVYVSRPYDNPLPIDEAPVEEKPPVEPEY